MDELLSKPQKRQLAILEHLLEQPMGIDLTNFLEKLNVSESVFYDDLRTIQTNVSTIEYQIKRGVIRPIHLNKNHALQLYRQFMQSLIEVQIIRDLFFRSLTSEELTEKYFISQSTLYRIIHTLNQLISKEFNIEIETNPYRIVGDERMIRLFYFHIFTRYYNSDYQKIGLTSLDFNWIISLFRFLDIGLSYGVVQKLKMFYTINVWRTMGKYHLSLENSRISGEHIHRNDPKISYIRAAWQRNLDVPFEKYYIEQIIYPYSEKYLLLFGEAEALLKDSPAIWKSYQILDESIDLLAEKFDIQIVNKKELIQTIHNNTYLQSYFSSVRLTFDDKGQFINNIQLHYPDFYREAYLLFYSYYEQFKLPYSYDQFINSLLQTMLYVWEDLDLYLTRRLKPLRVLLISSINTNHSHLIKTFIERYYGHIVEVFVYPHQQIDRPNILRGNYDIIISNFMMDPIGRARHIVTSDFPSAVDYMKMNEVIEWTIRTYIRLGI